MNFILTPEEDYKTLKLSLELILKKLDEKNEKSILDSLIPVEKVRIALGASRKQMYLLRKKGKFKGIVQVGRKSFITIESFKQFCDDHSIKITI